MTTTTHPLVPTRGGLLVEVEALDLLCRLPTASCKLIYLYPPFQLDSAGSPYALGNEAGQPGSVYLRLMHDLLVHARRALAPTGNLFVHYPSHHPSVNLGAALAQLFGQAQTHRISVPAQRSPLHRRGVPRSDTATFFFARVSEDATYHPPRQERTLGGAVRQDERGRFRWEVAEVPVALGPGRVFEFEDVSPAPGRAWKYSQERMAALLAEGRLERSAAGRWRLKRYEHELAPAEVSLEWSDLSTFVPPNERAVANDGRHRGPQEPLALLNRIIEMGSDAGDLVAVLSIGGAGTGAVASHHLGRRWVANSTPAPVAKWVQARLVAEGAVAGSDFELVCEADALAEPPQPVDDLPLLFTADQMRDSARHTASLRRMVARSFADAPERALAESLLARGIIAVHGFRPPGSQLEIGMFIPGPPFGVVEVRPAVPALAGEAIAQLMRYGLALSNDTRLYLVLFGGPDGLATAKVEPDSGVIVVTIAAGNWEEAARLVAEDHVAHQVRIGEAGELLEHEIRHLRDEIGHGHFTAAALRVGRSLEFIVYEACRSWGVEVREPILVGLTKLDNSKKELDRKLIDYADVDAGGPEAGRAKASVLKAALKLQGIVMEIVSDVDNSTAAGANDARPTRNPQALINDISKTHSRLKEVRTATNQMADPVDQLLKLRNAAAHASTDGDPREVSRDELSTMMGCLNQSLLGLSRCGTAIFAHRQGEER